MPVEELDASIVLFQRDVKRESSFPLIIEQTEDGNICLQCVFERGDVVRHNGAGDSVQVVGPEVQPELLRLSLSGTRHARMLYPKHRFSVLFTFRMLSLMARNCAGSGNVQACTKV